MIINSHSIINLEIFNIRKLHTQIKELLMNRAIILIYNRLK